MGKRGPPKKPTALKIVQGTAQPSRINPDEPVPTGPLGAPPKRMRAEGKRRWRWLSESAWWLTDADRGCAEQYCDRWALYRDAQKAIGHFGMIYEGKEGYTMINAALSAYTNCEKALMQLGGKLGLDPSSRADIVAPKRDQPGPNPFAING